MSERDELKPCPFCGGKADFERMGTSRQSCIVECESCGVRHESSDEYGRSGQSWNERQPTRAPQAVPALTVGWREKLIELANELDSELDGGTNWTRAQHTCCSVSGALRALAAAPQPSPEPQKAQELLKACRRAVMALAHASERMPQYNADYQAVSDAIAAYVAAEPKEQH